MYMTPLDPLRYLGTVKVLQVVLYGITLEMRFIWHQNNTQGTKYSYNCPCLLAFVRLTQKTVELNLTG